MASICPHCSRANPPGALFCYHDGSALGGRSRSAADPARRRFPRPFVFPSGRQCHTFDELVLACLDDWPTALNLLRQGALSGFLNGLGRSDLAGAAQEALRYPDRDRGLDQFLRRLPCQVLTEPRLAVEPTQINLGALRVGQDARLELHLSNQGMGLLTGTVSCGDADWLSLGGKSLFQFLHDATIPIQVLGKSLRASARPLEAHLTIDSAGGTVVVPVRAEVPIQPFPEGALAGARSPRELAEKAKERPREAAALFGAGKVATWYASNGWTYPVQGPTASGVASVQQFFEALGMTKPPKVEISETSVALTLRPGEVLPYTLKVSTAEKRPVYVHASSNTPWLRVAGIDLEGRAGLIRLEVGAPPTTRSGETLSAPLLVSSNGRQRWKVPVTVAVSGRPVPGPYPLPEPAPVPLEVVPARSASLPDWMTAPPPGRAREPVRVVDVVPVEPEPVQAVAVAVEPVPVELAFPAAQAPPPRRGRDPEREEPERQRVQTGRGSRGDFEFDGEAPQAVRAGPARQGFWAVVPVLFLALGLSVAVVRDGITWFRTPQGPDEKPPEGLVDTTPRLAIHFHDTEEQVRLAAGGGVKPVGEEDRDWQPGIWEPSMRFGLVALQDGQTGRPKRLTFEEKGLTNNTCVRLDGNEWLFGERPFRLRTGELVGSWPGRWLEREGKPDRTVYYGRKSTWIYDNQKVTVSQTVGLVAGAQSGLLDTCLVTYKIENRDTVPHLVGLRFLLDTFIGANDGVPFLLPGSQSLCSTSMDLSRPDVVPDFVQARESEDLSHPGTIAHLQLRLGKEIEAPSRVTLGAWPNPELGRLDPRCKQEKTLWDVPVLPIKSLTPPDSAVVMYWHEKPLMPGKSREVGFTYGLGALSGGEGRGQLALTVGGNFSPGGEFTVTAYVNNPQPGQTVTLTLPEGLRLPEDPGTRPVPPLPPDAATRVSPVSWKVRSAAAGNYLLKATTSNGLSQTQPVRIKVQGLFGS